MRKFVIKILIACVTMVLITGIISLSLLMIVAPQQLGSYNASILDKVERMESIGEPKILLVGHSNVAFGFDSEKIETEMGMPVVNLGLHGGLSNAFHENIAKLGVDDGDIVILCHSIFSESDGKIGDCDLAWHTLENHFELWRLIPVESWYDMLAKFPAYLQKTTQQWIEKTGNIDEGTIYSRSAFNEYGDVAFDRKENAVHFGEGSVSVPVIGEVAVRRINKLDAFCREKGAALLIAGYPIGDGEYTPNRGEFHTAWETLEEAATCPVISEIEDYFFPYDMFYDTKLHLTNEGVDLRTAQLIADLKRWQETK